MVGARGINITITSLGYISLQK